MGEGEYMSKRLEQYFYLVLGSTLLTLGIWLFVTPNQLWGNDWFSSIN